MPGSSHLHVLVLEGLSAASYTGRMVEALREAGHVPTVHLLRGQPGRVDRCAAMAADIVLARLPDGAEVLLDAALLPNLAAAVALDSRRLHLTALLDPAEALQQDGAADEARRHLERGVLAQMRRVVVPDAATAGLPTLEALGDRILVASPDAEGVDRLLRPPIPVGAARDRVLCHNA